MTRDPERLSGSCTLTPFARDYWPKIGDSWQLYLDAKERAMANTNLLP